MNVSLTNNNNKTKSPEQIYASNTRSVMIVLMITDIRYMDLICYRVSM